MGRVFQHDTARKIYDAFVSEIRQSDTTKLYPKRQGNVPKFLIRVSKCCLYSYFSLSLIVILYLLALENTVVLYHSILVPEGSQRNSW